ncbi:MAG: hypothetical protein IKD04_07185 [Clostridia bacterium]|nr:hypothetical protein [Clostridia bacterium]
MVVTSITALLFLNILSAIFQKKLQLSLKLVAHNIIGYNLLQGILGAAYFLLLQKFDFYINSTTLLYSIGYSLVVINALTNRLMALKYLTISTKYILSYCCSVIFSTLAGNRCHSSDIFEVLQNQPQ